MSGVTSGAGRSRLLMVEDNPGDARLLSEMFKEGGLKAPDVTHVARMSEAESHLATHAVDLILLDLGLPDAEGLTAVRRARAAAPDVPLVVLTGLDDEDLALRTLQEGAEDYLIKGQIEARGLLRSLRYAIERKMIEVALIEEKERAQFTLDSIADGVIVTDLDGRITFVNLVAARLTGWSSSEAVGQPITDVFQIIDGATREPVGGRVPSVTGDDASVRTQTNRLLRQRDDSEIPIDDAISPVCDRAGRPAGAVIVFRDVSSAREMARQLSHSAQHDFLTGLPNRMLLNDRIGQAIVLAARNGTKVTALFMDLDGFKHINDSLGHSIGDGLLKSVAVRLLGAVRESDTVSRLGGDEFVVLLTEGLQGDDASIVAKRILSAVAEAHRVNEHELHVTGSIGVSVYPDDAADPETLVKNADTAMYQAKAAGRHRFQFFESAMNVRAVERYFIEEGLRRALERQEFALVYQPKVDVMTGMVIGAEALLRWHHPTRGFISPLTFIPIAEETGLMLQIGEWVLREASRQARAWLEDGLPPLTMAVNVSGVEFYGSGFVERVFEVLDDARLDPSSLEIELTESVLMKRADSTEPILRSLRERGVRVAVDDFGTGYSSLGYLRRFPIDILKIDRSFVSQITRDGDGSSIVAAVINIARGLKIRVVAEGVETADQLAFLRARGCREVQGFLFSQPLAPERFAKLLKAHGAGGVGALDWPVTRSKGRGDARGGLQPD